MKFRRIITLSTFVLAVSMLIFSHSAYAETLKCHCRSGEVCSCEESCNCNSCNCSEACSCDSECDCSGAEHAGDCDSEECDCNLAE